MNDLEAVEISIDQAKEKIELMECLDRLTRNKDFKKLIDNDYLREESIRLVYLRADPNMQVPESQAHVNKSLDAIGALRAYFHKVQVQGMGALNSLSESEQVREEILAETQGD